MRVYIAAPYSARDYLRAEVSPAFTASGHELTSRWLLATRPIARGSINTAPDATDEEVRGYASTDLAEVAEADVLVSITGPYLGATMGLHPDRYGSGGRHVEVGYALALGKPVITVGAPENIFARGLTRVVPNITGALDVLARDHPQAWSVLAEGLDGEAGMKR